MVDVVDRVTRSRMMAGIRGRDTKPELLVRRGLHSLGFRYRLHDSRLPGKPDLVFPSRRAVILVHGCFWHLHGCRYSKLPSTRRAWWKAKLEGNRSRDDEVQQQLGLAGWRVLVIWECALRGPRNTLAKQLDATLQFASQWLRASEADASIPDLQS